MRRQKQTPKLMLTAERMQIYSAAKQCRNKERFMWCKYSYRDRAVVKKVRWAQRFLLIILVWYTESSFQNSQIYPNTWTSTCGYNATLMFIDAPCSTEPKQTLYNQNCLAQYQVKEFIFLLNFSFVTVPHSTRYLSRACHVPSPVKGIDVREKGKHKPWSLLSRSQLTSWFESNTSQ